MNVLVVGGDGFIGQYLCTELVGQFLSLEIENKTEDNNVTVFGLSESDRLTLAEYL